MKVLVVGSIGRTSVELAGFCKHALEDLGNIVSVAVYNDCRLSARWTAVRPIERYIAQKIFLRRIKKFSPDLILTIKGDCLDVAFLERIRKTRGITIVNYWIDDPLFLNISKIKSPHYDIFFTNAVQCVEAHRQAGCKNVKFLSFGYDSKLHRKIILSERERVEFGSDILFTGTLSVKRLELLRPLAGMSLKVWSNYQYANFDNGRILLTPIRKNHPFFPHVTGRPLWGDDMVRACCASKIVLNLHVQDTPTMRDFEVTACGAFLLTNYVPGLEDFFKIGSEIVCFKTQEELRTLAEYYLIHTREREEIAKRGYERTRRDHSYSVRMAGILKAVQELQR